MCTKILGSLKIINENAEIPITISQNNLKDFLGLPKYLREENKVPLIGVVHGLAWNQLGGDVLMIESVAIPNDTKNFCMELVLCQFDTGFGCKP